MVVHEVSLVTWLADPIAVTFPTTKPTPLDIGPVEQTMLMLLRWWRFSLCPLATSVLDGFERLRTPPLLNPQLCACAQVAWRLLSPKDGDPVVIADHDIKM